MALPDGLAALFNMRPDRAADYLLEKDLQLTGPYWELDGPAHSRVFTVANLAKLDVLADIKAVVQEAIDTGETERWFRQQLEGTLRKKGWWGPLVQVDPVTLEARIIQAGSRRRLQTIYRTNLQSAYMAGRHAQALEQADRAPWAQYLAVRDSRTRPAHAALHGKVFRIDSPEWSVISPPNGYNCRCRARYMSDRELAQRGLTPETDVRLLERTPERVPTDPLTGETPARIIERGVSVPSRTRPGERDVLWADRGWDHLPGSDGAERALVDRIMATADKVGDIREVVLAELRRNGVEVALPPVPVRPPPPVPQADLAAWHEPIPTDVDAVLERGTAREAELFGASAKNMDRRAAKIAKLEADLSAKREDYFRSPLASPEVEQKRKYYEDALSAVMAEKKPGANAMARLQKAMQAKVAEREALMRAQGLTVPSAKDKAATLRIGDYAGDDLKELRKNAESFYRQFGATADTVKAVGNRGDRAYCSATLEHFHTVNMGKSAKSARVLFHEFGHSVEFTNKTAATARAWYMRRATGPAAPLRDLTKNPNYEADEMAYPGPFFDAYVAKDYGDSATEVMSMGLQNFTDPGNLLSFWLKDREHFRLVLGLLAL